MGGYGYQKSFCDNTGKIKNKNNLQPIHNYLHIIIRDHLDDFRDNGHVDTRGIIKKTYMYGRKIGYNQKPEELTGIIARIIHEMMECCRKPGKPLHSVSLEHVRVYLTGIQRK